MSRGLLGRLNAGRATSYRHERHPARAGIGDDVLAAVTGSILVRLSPLLRRGSRVAARRAIAQQAGLRGLADDALSRHIAGLRHRLLRARVSEEVIAAALAAVAEVASRTLGQPPYPVQLVGAAEILKGRVIEMATGEGKTLTAALAAAVLGLARIPVDVFTVNAYLARRDAQSLTPFFAFLGLSIAAITGEESESDRAAAYGCEILYAVNKELVFDYLRHRLQSRHGVFAGRGLYVAIVDEADGILVDEARTPLIIAQEHEPFPAGILGQAFRVADSLVPGCDFVANHRARSIDLRDPGRAAARGLSAAAAPEAVMPTRLAEDLLRQALAAKHLYRRDHDYLVAGGRIHIIDESTGRVLADRQWERGLHQLIEVKEGCHPTPARRTVGRITYPDFFRRYMAVGGMSGTVREVAGELRRVYGCQVVRLPTHRPVIRRDAWPRIATSSAQRWRAVTERIAELSSRGRPVLVGTRSVGASETMAALLRARGIEHVILNARQDVDEARIVARAGEPGRVTVATNMAGRGTDILLDAAARAAGGLAVVMTEFHESNRIDRQLFGRAGRQGDPGSAEGYGSLDDELFARHAGALVRFLGRFAGRGDMLPRVLARLLVVMAQWRAGSLLRTGRLAGLSREDMLRRRLGFGGKGE
jgi:preprotein translocase subunit SecA